MFLVISKASWHFHLGLVGSLLPSVHFPHRSWIMMVRQHHDGLCVLPNAESELFLLSYPEVMFSHSSLLGQHFTLWKALPVGSNSAASIQAMGLHLLQQLYSGIEVVHIDGQVRAEVGGG